MNSLITEYKGHLSVALSKVVLAMVLLDALNIAEKGLAIVIAIIMAIWGVRHLRSRTELNHELKRQAKIKNEMMEQELFERWKKNLN
jgi:hypothetical protein